MNPLLGWGLAALALAAGWQAYQVKGLVLAATLIVFWLVLQFNRSVRVMKNASAAPIGHVGSAVMMNARLKKGMTLLQIITATRSLGRRVVETPETWAWTDEGASTVTVVMVDGKLTEWTLDRPGD